MRIASNSLADLIAFYHSELTDVYETSEIDSILNLALEHYSGISQRNLLLNREQNLNQSELLKLYLCCKELKKNIPIQYILKEAWFYNLKFYVDDRVLIPRPETEELVDIILKENPGNFSLLDIGTGSGCIPVAIKKNRPGNIIMACDISREALMVANKNAALHLADVKFIETDILNTETAVQKIEGGFDIIVSNPPYIMADEKQEMSNSVLDKEPHLALFVKGNDPVLFYKKIIDLCVIKLSSCGKLYFELNPLTASGVSGYAKQKNIFQSVELLKDMSGKNRFLKAVKFK